MKHFEDKTVRVQDKGSRFVVLNTNKDVEEVEQQGPFYKLNSDH